MDSSVRKLNGDADQQYPKEDETQNLTNSQQEWISSSNNYNPRNQGYNRRILEVPTWRRILPQAMSSCAMGLICINIGVTLSFPTIVVDDIKRNKTFILQNLEDPYNTTQEILQYENENETTLVPYLDSFGDFNSKTSGIPQYAENGSHFFEELDNNFDVTESELALYVGLAYLCQPVGSIIGGWAIGYFGRKKLMVSVNLVYILGWLVLFFSRSIEWMYVSNILLGIGIGFCEGTFATYIPEVTEPHLRGIMVGVALCMFNISILFPYIVQLLINDWRWNSLIQCGIPVITLLVMSLVPETPHWLVSRGMIKEAERSLMTLRGWVPAENVRQELQDIIKNHKEMTTSDLGGTKWEIWKEKIMYMFNYRIRSPFLLISSMFLILYLSGYSTMRPFLSEVFDEMKTENTELTVNTDGFTITVVGLAGGFVTFIIIKFTGKKLLLIGSLIAGGVLTTLLGLTQLKIIGSETIIWWMSMLNFCTALGIQAIPWMMQGDLYPFRGRGLASGTTAAVNYLIGFVCTTLFLDVMKGLSLTGVFFLCACFNFIGALYLWFVMPETEGKTHMEIDKYYQNKMDKRKGKSLSFVMK